jgi:membrane-bound lytic murein transglycosylase B
MVALFSALVAAGPACASSDWTPLIKRLIADDFPEQNMQTLFAHPGVKFDPDAMSSKLRDLITSRYRKTGAEPSGKYPNVHDRFLKPAVIDGARAYSQNNLAALKAIEKYYCVPGEIIVAILLIETDLGGYLGSRPAFNTLASMAASTSLETIRPYLPVDLITPENEAFAMKRCSQKSDWAYRELKALIRYAAERGIDPLAIPGSIYGAIGICQFMPSKISAYGVDADHDGRIDVFSKDDALFSVANYLRRHGWRCNLTRTKQRKIIMAYNHSNLYANTVLQVAEKLRQKN